MARRTRPPVFPDLDQFLQIAELLRSGLSFRQIASQLKPPTTVWGVRDILGRLETNFQTQLVARANKASGANQLTPEGEQLLQRLRDLCTWRPDNRPPVRVGISQSLLTSQLFTPPLESFLRKPTDAGARAPELHVSVRAVMEIERILLDVQTGELDLAIVWGVERRLKEFPGLVRALLPSPFDLVFISRDKAILDTLYSQSANNHQLKWSSIDMEQLTALRLISMGPNDQPLYDHLPMPDATKGGGRTEVGSIDIVIALVRARVGDVGLVPAIYSELDRFRGEGELYYSPPLDKQLKLALFTRRPGIDRLSTDAKRFVARLIEYLEKGPNQSLWSAGADQLLTAHFPAEPAFYEKFQFGYYIDIDRAGNDGPKWKWQEVEVLEQADKTALGKGIRFRGSLKNSFAATFKFDGELFLNKFAIRAGQPEQGGEKASVHSFISVFTLCSLEGLMFGMWIGNDPEFRPGQYATLWSHNRLELENICEVARLARIRWLHNVMEGHEFDKQPWK